ncbi:hypothetical protein Salat_2138800 [Sesamum alatum]|uniref:Uncharacterized protein n=1 Tax=Sesamum alatum TaxID=300844 RepID=A0AAE1Y1P2_9LAMI|nr:hypothetical protein Salat_2138800 [Sesamum alatum]
MGFALPSAAASIEWKGTDWVGRNEASPYGSWLRESRATRNVNPTHGQGSGDLFGCRFQYQASSQGGVIGGCRGIDIFDAGLGVRGPLGGCRSSTTPVAGGGVQPEATAEGTQRSDAENVARGGVCVVDIGLREEGEARTCRVGWKVGMSSWSSPLRGHCRIGPIHASPARDPFN